MKRDRAKGNAQTPGHRKCRKRYSVAGRKCSECGEKNDLTRDHKDHNPDNNDPSNIQILCRACHGRKDANYRWREHKKIKHCEVCSMLFEYSRAGRLTCSEKCRRQLQVETREARK